MRVLGGELRRLVAQGPLQEVDGEAGAPLVDVAEGGVDVGLRAGAQPARLMEDPQRALAVAGRAQCQAVALEDPPVVGAERDDLLEGGERQFAVAELLGGHRQALQQRDPALPSGRIGPLQERLVERHRLLVAADPLVGAGEVVEHPPARLGVRRQEPQQLFVGGHGHLGPAGEVRRQRQALQHLDPVLALQFGAGQQPLEGLDNAAGLLGQVGDVGEAAGRVHAGGERHLVAGDQGAVGLAGDVQQAGDVGDDGHAPQGVDALRRLQLGIRQDAAVGGDRSLVVAGQLGGDGEAPQGLAAGGRIGARVVDDAAIGAGGGGIVTREFRHHRQPPQQHQPSAGVHVGGREQPVVVADGFRRPVALLGHHGGAFVCLGA